MNRPGRPGVACPVDDPELVVVPWILTTVARDVVIPVTVIGVWTRRDQSGLTPRLVPPVHYGMSSGHPPETLVTVTFAEHEGKTKLTLRHSVPDSVEEREGTQQSWTEMMDRLAEVLAVRKGGIR